MRRKAVSGMMLTLLLIGMLTLAFNIQPVEASGTIYIRADGSVEPDTAPISSVDNVTYIFSGNIYDEIVVERDNIVVDGAGYALQGTGSGTGIDLTGRSNVTIKNTEIKSFMRGIWLGYGSSNCTISGNNITNNWNGICIYHSSNYNAISGNNITENHNRGITLYGSSNFNNISGNTITNNSDGIGLYAVSNFNTISENNITNNGYGIRLYGSSNNNTVSGNNITANNGDGILLDESSKNTLTDNDASNNEYNFGVYGLELSHYLQDIDDSNTVNGKPIYYWVNRRDVAIPLDAGYVALVNCTRMTVKNLNLTNNGQGVILASTTNSTITKNNITNNTQGIKLFSSANNDITGNHITNNEYGIDLDGSSNNTISENSIKNNGYGIRLDDSSNNTINGNNITENGRDGIRLSGSNNIVSGNKITNNFAGIWLDDSSNNIISGNSITNNFAGIWLDDSSNNIIFHNNFVDNLWLQVFSYESTNVWDDGYPSGGNYWSDYVGVDLFSGPFQNESGCDGIGDTPYVITVNNTDHYPLMNPRPDVTPPKITILSPENITYTTASVPLIFAINECCSWIGYSLDNQANVTITGNTTLTSLSYGTHNIIVYANDTSGNMGVSETVYFTISGHIIDLYTQKEPFNGKGLNAPSDAFAPQEEVTLYAYVSHYGDPVANKLVAFQVNDPTGEIYLYRTNSTDENGIATISFRIPSTPVFGEWTVYATVDITEQTVNDILTFRVGWIVEILQVETVDTYGASKFSFTKGEHVHFNVTVRNIAFTSKEATITIVVYDECGVPIGHVTLHNWLIPSGTTQIFIIDLQIPKWSYVGVATIHANAYTDLPTQEGTPTCPEAYATFMITRT